VDISLAGELFDADGKSWWGWCGSRQGPLYLGGSTFEGSISFTLAVDQRPESTAPGRG